MTLVAVLPTRAGLASVAGVGVDGGDHPVSGNLAGDLPPSGALAFTGDPFDILARDQRQQRQRLSRLRVRFGLLGVGPAQCGHDGQRVAHQGIDQLFACGFVVPGDLGFARLGVVARGCIPHHCVLAADNDHSNPADRGDQLGDGVLGGDGVVEDRRVQRPSRSSFSPRRCRRSPL